jgi:acyl dehydratase
MPLQTELVGQSTSPRYHAVDARWTMAYAAGLQDENPRLRDTTQARLAVHPLFPVCLEWPSVLESRALPGHDGLSDEELARGVHATHDLHVVKPIVPGQVYHTTATVVDLQPGQQGARVCLQLDTSDEAGDLVTRTWQTNVSRGVMIQGPAATPIAQAPAWPEINQSRQADGARREIPIAVSAGLGNIYTETARIYNPIHSDRAFALAAGLPDIILHGTASLGLSVSALGRELLGGAVNQVTRLGGRFTGMVVMPQTLTLHITAQGSDWALFELRNDVQAPVLKDGFMVWSQVSATAII